MPRFILVGDPHLDNRTPISRLDDYGELTIHKLNNLLKEALEQDITHIILSGDVFDKYQVSFVYLNELIKVLNSFREKGITIYSVIGNHDLPYNSKRYFKQTPLSLLFEAGLIKHLVREEFDDVILYGIDFTEMDKIQEINEEPKTEKKEILTMHYAVDNTIPYESIDGNNLTRFNVVLSGHDHNYYPAETKHSEDGTITRILRPGSFTRRTKDAYNLTRPIVYYTYDSDTDIVEYRTLRDVRPSKEVFKNEVINSSVSSFDSSTFSQVFNEAYFKKEALAFEDLIKDLPIDITSETKAWLLNYFKQN